MRVCVDYQRRCWQYDKEFLMTGRTPLQYRSSHQKSPMICCHEERRKQTAQSVGEETRMWRERKNMFYGSHAPGSSSSHHQSLSNQKEIFLNKVLDFNSTISENNISLKIKWHSNFHSIRKGSLDISVHHNFQNNYTSCELGLFLNHAAPGDSFSCIINGRSDKHNRKSVSVPIICGAQSCPMFAHKGILRANNGAYKHDISVIICNQW